MLIHELTHAYDDTDDFFYYPNDGSNLPWNTVSNGDAARERGHLRTIHAGLLPTLRRSSAVPLLPCSLRRGLDWAASLLRGSSPDRTASVCPVPGVAELPILEREVRTTLVTKERSARRPSAVNRHELEPKE